MIGGSVRSHLSVPRAMVRFAARWNMEDAPDTEFFRNDAWQTVYTYSDNAIAANTSTQITTAEYDATTYEMRMG